MAEEMALIEFACSGCGKAFSVPRSFAGRRATCKGCGAKVIVAESLSPAGQNGKSQPTPTHGNWATTPPNMVSAPKAPTGESAIPTADPTQPIRRMAPIAMISEAQSPPVASGLTAPTLARSQLSDLVRPPTVPTAVAERPIAPGQASPKIPMRIRRLMVDAEQMTTAFSSGEGPIRVKSAIGEPPESYQIEYHVRGLQKGWLGKPKQRGDHLVEIQLTSEYPRVSPKCKMLTPVFHPNIDESTICVGDHWTAGARLVDLVVQIGEMLSYQAYNIKSPLNGEAAMWADLNGDKLPIDSQNLHPQEPG
jgi:ubiquitin-protein ligase/DNA-directed RNA polymerase subunit RPC12/RpoP